MIFMAPPMTAGPIFYEIMKRVCRIIHMDPYQPADIHKRLVTIKENGVDTNDGK